MANEKPKWTTDGAPLEDSNMAHVGSEEDKAARVAAAETEEAWVGAGDAVGLKIWRIEQFQVVPWPEDEYGNFYKGDSYIVLDTTADADSGKLLWDIHFWLGSGTSQDEMGTAAYKTVELDDLLGGAATQHREVEGHESEAFMELFPQLNYMEGGVESGFNPVTPEAYIAKLFMVRREKKSVKVQQVPLASGSLNHGDCFMLDAGERVFTWFGDHCSPFEKNKCNLVAQNLATKRAGRAEALQHDADPEVFWAILGGSDGVVSAAEGDEMVQRLGLDEVGEGVLHKLTDAHGGLVFSEVGRGNIHSGMLESSDVFVLDAQSELFIWLGKDATSLERSKALDTAVKYLETYGKPAHTPIHLFKEGTRIRNQRWKAIMAD